MQLYIVIKAIIIPLCIVVIGYFLKNHPPKTINYIYGYKTARSMKSQEAWDYSQKRCGQLFLIIGLILCVITFLVIFLLSPAAENEFFAVIILQVLSPFLPVFIIEKELKNKFN